MYFPMFKAEKDYFFKVKMLNFATKNFMTTVGLILALHITGDYYSNVITVYSHLHLENSQHGSFSSGEGTHAHYTPVMSIFHSH